MWHSRTSYTVVVLDIGGDLDDKKQVIKTQSGFKLLHDAIGSSLNVERNMKIGMVTNN